MDEGVKTDAPLKVSIADIDMPFVEMVFFLIKWALATIMAVATIALPIALLKVFLHL